MYICTCVAAIWWFYIYIDIEEIYIYNIIINNNKSCLIKNEVT